MKTLFFIGIGIYIGKELFGSSSSKDQRTALQKKVKRYIAEHLPELSAQEVQRDVELLFS